MEFIPDIYFRFDLDANLVQWNKTVEIATGLAPETLKNRSALELVVEEDRPSFIASIRKCIEEGEAGSEVRVLNAHGGSSLYRFSGVALKDEGGKVVGIIGTGRDITERKEAEEALRDSEDRYRDLVEHGRDLICTHDLEGRILSVNPWAAKVLGYAPDELLQMNFRELLAPKVRKDFDAYVDEIRKHGAAQGLLLVQTRTGEDRILEYNNTLRTDGVAEPIVRGMAHDITERKRAEDGLRNNRNMLAHIMDSIPQSVFWKDRDSVYLGCNKVFARQAGIDNPDEITGKNDFDLPWSHKESDAYRADDREVMENNRPKLHIIETQHQADGSRVWLDTTKIPLKNEAGRVYGVLGVYEDITERKRAEETLTRLGMAVEQAVEAIVITDTEGRIEYVNPAFEHITGYPREEAIGQNMRILKSGKNDESSYRSMWETISRGEVWKGRLTNRKKDGTFYDEETTISPVRDVSGKIVNYVSGKRDITRELMLQNQVHAAQRMESVGTLAGGVAHDFNNILTVILGCAEILTVRYPATDPSYQAVEEIRQAANRAAGLTRQLLAFSRKQILQPKVIGINSIVTEMDRMLRRLIGEDIDIVTVLEDGFWYDKGTRERDGSWPLHRLWHRQTERGLHLGI
jgi:PAS domain S-box-containing protein